MTTIFATIAAVAPAHVEFPFGGMLACVVSLLVGEKDGRVWVLGIESFGEWVMEMIDNGAEVKCVSEMRTCDVVHDEKRADWSYYHGEREA